MDWKGDSGGMLTLMKSRNDQSRVDEGIRLETIKQRKKQRKRKGEGEGKEN